MGGDPHRMHGVCRQEPTRDPGGNALGCLERNVRGTHGRTKGNALERTGNALKMHEGIAGK